MNKKIISITIVAVMVLLLVTSLGLIKKEQTQTIEQVKTQYEAWLMAIDGVVGAGIGECEGKPCIEVYLENDSPDLKKQIPQQLNGFKVVIEVTGAIEVLPKGNEQVSSTLSEAEARTIAEKFCIKGGEALSIGTYNQNTKTWWFDANLNATREGCNSACVVIEETKTAEINWRCTGFKKT